MLLETVEPPVSLNTTFIGLPSKTETGTVIVDTTNVGKGAVSLSGSGPDWNAQGNYLNLIPASQKPPIWYQITLTVNTGSPYSLIGAQVSTQDKVNSTFFFPASKDVQSDAQVVVIDLLNNLSTGDAVSYTLGLGFQLGADGPIVWIADPTITFDPQT